MTYKQDGFLTGLLTNFRKRKAFKTEAKETTGVYNPESNTVNVKEGENVIKMPMRKYTKKALENKPTTVVGGPRSSSHTRYPGHIAYNMEFSEDQAVETNKPSKAEPPKQKKYKKKRYKTPKGTKKKGLYLKKGKFIKKRSV